MKNFKSVKELIKEIKKDTDGFATSLANGSVNLLLREVYDAYADIKFPLKIGKTNIANFPPRIYQKALESKVVGDSAVVFMQFGKEAIDGDLKNEDIAKKAQKYEIFEFGPFKKVWTKFKEANVLASFFRKIGVKSNFKLRRK